ncbi:MAG: hypothetical protein KAU49_01305 [Candidatus Krumholzibacteria bacterium]|nr:hypothetical protein [Candidatus Krumholzibacteria bacterium]
MKKVLTCIVAAAVLMVLSGASMAAVGWSGNIWPVHGTSVTEGADVGVYYQVWKEGVTEGEGAGAGLATTLFYGPNGGPYTSLAMGYIGEVGNNDEYSANIPALALEGNSELWFYCEVYDSTDASTAQGQDQNSNDPPFVLNITASLGQDVMVYFRICLAPDGDPDYDPTPGDVCVVGDAAELTAWGAGVPMVQPCPGHSPLYYEVGILFAAGGNPAIQYKYKKNDCVNWESVGNRMDTIDDTGPTYIIPWVDHWNNYVGDDCPLCGIGTEESTWGAIKKIHN